MTNPTAVAESEGATAVPLPWEKEATSKPEVEWQLDDFEAPRTQFRSEPKHDKSRGSPSKEELPSVTHTLDQTPTERFEAIHREELDGYVEKITEGIAYVVFKTGAGALERAVKLSKLAAINADRQGALIRLVVEEKGPAMSMRFENLEEKGIATWRDKIKDEDLEKYDLLKKSASSRKPSELQ